MTENHSISDVTPCQGTLNLHRAAGAFKAQIEYQGVSEYADASGSGIELWISGNSKDNVKLPNVTKRAFADAGLEAAINMNDLVYDQDAGRLQIRPCL